MTAQIIWLNFRVLGIGFQRCCVSSESRLMHLKIKKLFSIEVSHPLLSLAYLPKNNPYTLTRTLVKTVGMILRDNIMVVIICNQLIAHKS